VVRVYLYKIIISEKTYILMCHLELAQLFRSGSNFTY